MPRSAATSPYPCRRHNVLLNNARRCDRGVYDTVLEMSERFSQAELGGANTTAGSEMEPCSPVCRSGASHSASAAPWSRTRNRPPWARKRVNSRHQVRINTTDTAETRMIGDGRAAPTARMTTAAASFNSRRPPSVALDTCVSRTLRALRSQPRPLLDWGSRGRRVESGQPDQGKSPDRRRGLRLQSC